MRRPEASQETSVPRVGRRRRSLARFLGPVVALLLALSAGCADQRDDGYFGSTSRRGKDVATFYINGGVEPEYLDPGKCNDTASSLFVAQLFEGLTSHHPKDLHPIQGAAERWDKSADGLRYRFHLRPGAKWSDGVPVTARDFEYAFRRVLRPATASRSAARLYPLKNGELFNLRRLKVASTDLSICPEPRPCGAGAPILPKGAAARIVDGPAAGATEGPRYLKIERFFDLPFSRREPGAGAKEAPITGYVDASALVEDEAVVGVRASDDLTLDVELERPTPYFLDLTSNPTLSPVRRDVIERFKGQEDLWVRPENIVVNGPYTLDEWKFRYEITMKVNPEYRDRDKMRVKRVVWLEVEDYRSTMNLYKSGELDFIGPSSALPSEYMDLLSLKRDFRRFPYLATYWYEVNTNVPPLNDARVRWALNLAVDKRELALRITRSGQIPATHYVPDFTGGGYAELAAAEKESGADPFSAPDMDFNPPEARRLLIEAGYPIKKEWGGNDAEGDGYRAEGFPPVEILYNTGEGHRNIAVALQSMWQRHLGISVSLRNEEWKVLLKNVRDGRFQIVRSGQTASYEHPQAWLETFLSYSPENHSGWADPEFDALLKRAAQEPDAKESMRLYRRAELKAVRGMSRIPLYFYTKSTLVKPWVKGYYGNTQNLFMAKWAWIDPDWRSGGPDEPAFPPEELPPPGIIEGPW